MRKLGVAAASAALVGTIAAVLPAGIAHADVQPPGTTLPSATDISKACDPNPSDGDVVPLATDCWRATTVVDDGSNTHGAYPAISGNKLILNQPTPNLANADWWNRPISIAGQSIEVSFTAYADGATQVPACIPYFPHDDGVTFALIESEIRAGEPNFIGNNHPAPVPFDPTPADQAHPQATEYGAGGNGLGFGGFDGNGDNADGHKNLAVALITSADETNVGGCTNFDVSKFGLLKGAAWGGAIEPHVRSGRWYGNGPLDMPGGPFYGRTTGVPVSLKLDPKTGAAGTWVARLTVDGVEQPATEVDLPDVVIMGFTAGTGEFPQRHAVSDVSIKYGTPYTPPPPPVTGAGLPYKALEPTRILDTRLSGGPIGPGVVRPVQVAGVKNVPADAAAVVMNVTVDQPTADGFVTIFPTGQTPPLASNLNFVAGQAIANLVTAKVGAGGQVSILNFAGNTHVLFDVVGYFPSGTATTALSTSAGEGGQFVPLSPARILDTRSGVGAPTAPLGPNESLDLQVAGAGGVPPTGVAAVVMNLTGTNTTAAGFLTAWPTGGARQTTSSLNFVAGQSVPNLAVVPLGAGGKVSIYNFDGTTDVLADVVGYYTAQGVTVPGGGLFHAMSPVRFLDTRPEVANKTLADGGTVTQPIIGVSIPGQSAVPADAGGVVANVTATNTKVPGFLTVFPTGETRPGTSSLNFAGGEPGVPNLVMSKLGGGNVSIFNFSPGGTTDVLVDVVGWYGPT